MGRRSERLCKRGQGDIAGEGDVIQVVSRAFDVLRCFEGADTRLGNLEISNRCGLPRSTVSRLTHTLTRMGQLVYLPRDQKYRIGPSAVAMSTAMMRGLQLRNLIRARLQEVADQIPGTVGFLIPDRFHLVYFEYARAAHTLGLHSTTGSRIAMSRSAGGHAYLAALQPEAANAFLTEIEREEPEQAPVLRERLEASRTMLRERGYVISCGVFSPHVNGVAVPMWSPQYQTHVVVNIGLLGAMYDEQRIHDEVAPALLRLKDVIDALVQNAESGLVAVGQGAAKRARPDGKSLQATRRPAPSHSLTMSDTRRRQGQAPA
ncbi:transcriptional regulator [Rhodopseudomonas sp. AAP120]|jgi:DNA-binding IclR family transcriptional regulator|uniref:IclR family transcriptional regulator n=1 Tax=Rhodopseudomonas sp. AAP120 TaxID=1523430 RepID=UPI0006B94A06|nr:IclR family transcriptional regulator [Rhodopseudomonas sp. AAP120]KPF90600.1 transcriptional regulator [Rhodopseudomonas sp. AAP120]